MATQSPRSGPDYKKRIIIFALIAVLAAATLAVAVTAFFPTGATASNDAIVGENSSASAIGLSLKGPVPLITVTHQNNTFTLAYNATALTTTVTNLSFNLSQSYITIYTNGTEWVPYSQACSSNLESSTASETIPSQSSSFSVSVTTASANSCDYPAPLGWAPTNGTIVEQYAKLNSSEVEMSILPTTIATNQTVSLQFTITLNLKPGVYDVGLGLGVQTTSFFEFSDLNPFPVLVKS